MKPKMPNAALVWKQLDDVVVPSLRLNVIDRAVYSHLLRHTRLEGQHRLGFTQTWLAKGVGVCRNTARSSMRRLASRGAIRLIESTSTAISSTCSCRERCVFGFPARRTGLCSAACLSPRRSCASLRPQSTNSIFSPHLPYAAPSLPVSATLASTAGAA